MIVAIALCDFSQEIMNQPQTNSNDKQPQTKKEDHQQEEIEKAINENENENEADINEQQIDQNNIEQNNDTNHDDKSKDINEIQDQIPANISDKEQPLDIKCEENIEKTEENKQIQQNDNPEPESSAAQIQQQPQQMQYLTFQKNDRIVVKYQYENGWWWGCLLGIRDPVDGYFPSTYVKVSHRIGDDYEDNQQQLQEEDIEKMGWKEYASYVKMQAQTDDIDKQYEKFINDTQERKETNLDRFLNPGIKGYKKVKIDPSNQDSFKNIKGSFFSKEGDTVFIPIKSQDPLDKAHRQLNHFFDYDAWNEQMNNQKQRRANPNINKKKEKNDAKFLSKLK